MPKGKNNPEDGTLTYKIKPGALIRNPQNLDEISQGALRCRIIVEAYLPRVRISGGIGLNNEERVRQAWEAIGTAFNPNYSYLWFKVAKMDDSASYMG